MDGNKAMVSHKRLSIRFDVCEFSIHSGIAEMVGKICDIRVVCVGCG